MIKAGIIGATGYAGAEVIRLLAGHPEAEIVWYGSKSYIGRKYASLFGNSFDIIDAECLDDDLDRLSEQADVIFTATPQGYLSSIINDDILSRAKVIDLSADFRFKSKERYEEWYGIEHKAPQYMEEAVYGLCEINRAGIKGARLIANPGCYTTCSILTCYPMVKEGLIDADSIIVDALSGVSGAGRGAKVDNLFSEVNESARPYGVAVHRHTPEIEDQLGYAAGHEITLSFTPHLIPMNRGILSTCYATMKKVPDGKGGERYPSPEEIRSAYEKYYGDEHFIRLLPDGVYPDTKWVETSNYTDIGFKADERTGRLIMVGALDNLVKGAAGQAVQNMNILFGLPEETGLNMMPVFP